MTALPCRAGRRRSWCRSWLTASSDRCGRKRIRAVLDYHGLRGALATGQAEIAARYDVTARSASNWVTTVAAAGARLPLSPEMATQISRRSRPGEDHRGRTRVASTL